MILNKLAHIISSSTTIAFILVLIPLCIKACYDVSRQYCDHYLYSILLNESEFEAKNEENLSRKIAMLQNNSFYIMNKD